MLQGTLPGAAFGRGGARAPGRRSRTRRQARPLRRAVAMRQFMLTSATALDSPPKFRFCSPMGAKDPNRQPRLGSVRDTPPGWLRLLTCNTCAHRGVLPAERLLRKHGDLAMLEFALVAVRCTACGALGATMTMVRLCDAGCPRRR